MFVEVANIRTPKNTTITASVFEYVCYLGMRPSTLYLYQAM